MLVKKYSNRRLYDTESSRYITLEELAHKIQSGADARVIDAKSGAELTQATLTQIILESRRGAQLLPVPLLLSLIRMKDDALSDFFGRYVTWALELYTHARQGAQAVTTMSPLATLALQTNPLARFLFSGNLGFPGGPPPAAAPPTAPVNAGSPDFEPDMGDEPESPPPPPPSSASASEVAALRRELDELKRSLGHTGDRTRARAPKQP